jgi:hypothetical protein
VGIDKNQLKRQPKPKAIIYAYIARLTAALAHLEAGGLAEHGRVPHHPLPLDVVFRLHTHNLIYSTTVNSTSDHTLRTLYRSYFKRH